MAREGGRKSIPGTVFYFIYLSLLAGRKMMRVGEGMPRATYRDVHETKLVANFPDHPVPRCLKDDPHTHTHTHRHSSSTEIEQHQFTHPRRITFESAAHVRSEPNTHGDKHPTTIAPYQSHRSPCVDSVCWHGSLLCCCNHTLQTTQSLFQETFLKVSLRIRASMDTNSATRLPVFRERHVLRYSTTHAK